ncbi:hypothetical protein J4471_01825 [Candidatus Woesearchaeota archaeon]|nr:hypothetical protein [Candidatus Woesearchaeota archaeon]
MKAIVTTPPYSPFIDEVVAHPIVSGLRLNTVMPIKGNLEDTLRNLQDKAKDKDLWIDLKCRQLRVVGYWTPPFTEIQLSHKIKVDTPVTAYFGSGKEKHIILEVNEDKLIMQDGPKRVVGPGESVNIVNSSLCIDGYFTDTDMKYIEAATKLNLNKFMLSFVESKQDIDLLRTIYPDSRIVAKIESQKGIKYVDNEYKKEVRLMAARGDLFMEVRMPHQIISAIENIIKKDKNAIVASRIFDSLAYNLEPSCSDIGDVDNLIRMGYKTFMFGDEICMERNSIISGLNLLEYMICNHLNTTAK